MSLKNMIKYDKMLQYVGKFTMKDNRVIFQYLRSMSSENNVEDLFLPQYGLSVGEFCTFYLLNKKKTMMKKK